LSIKVKEHREPMRPSVPTDMSRHTVNIDRDQARVRLDLERTSFEIGDANWKEQMSKLRLIITGLFTASGEVL
jgi:hypothetical protein